MTMDMGRNKKMVSYALDPAVIARMETWLARQELPPSKTAFVELALKKLLDEVEAKK